jgi:hypothetical protein
MDRKDGIDLTPKALLARMRKQGWICEKRLIWIGRKGSVTVRAMDVYELAIRATDAENGKIVSE